MEHHSNIVPWHFHRERKGAVLKWVARSTTTARSRSTHSSSALTPRTKIVAITHMSNVLGTVTPVKEIVRIAHERGIPVLIDGSQGAVHLDVDVRDLDADFYVFTGHKLYGPTGIGVLYGKREWLEQTAALQGRRRDDRRRDDGPRHLQRRRRIASRPARRRSCRRSGSARRSTTWRASAATRIRAHEARSRATMRTSACRAINSLRIYRHAPGTRAPIISFKMEGAHAHDVATVIDRSGVAVRAGTHCAHAASGALWRDLDLPRLVRALQYPRGSRPPGRGADASAEALLPELNS